MRRLAFLAAVIAVLVGAAAWWRYEPDCTPRPGVRRPSVVLVTIDTLRADHLGCYGNTTVRTPELDHLARNGVLFERCYSQTHVTVPSHLSILSSLPLADHGLTSNLAKATHPVEVLPTIFARAGYRTAAFVSAKHLGPLSTIGSLLGDFQMYEAPTGVRRRLAATETNRRLFRWLRGACRDPFFVWVHYWDPHMPYTPPPPFDRAYYSGNPYDPQHTSMQAVTLSWYFHELGDLGGRLLAHPHLVRPLKRKLGVNGQNLRRLVLNPHDLPARLNRNDRTEVRARLEELGHLVRPGLPYRRHLADWLTGVRDLRFPLAQYAGEVSYVDQEIGQLRGELEQLGLSDRTVLVVTGDHGEGLGEHGIYFDHYGLHEPSLRVPLIVWAPGRLAPAQQHEVARGLDVAPTLLRLAGLPVPASMQGRDLFASAPADEAVIAEATRSEQVMVQLGGWKLIRTLESFHYVDAFAREAGTTELYDLDHDPGEAQNVAASYPHVTRALGERLDGWLAAHRGAAPVETLSPEKARELRALGYVE